MTPEQILRDLYSRGVEVSRDGDRLRFRPVEAVPDELRVAMAANKVAMLALLAEDAASAARERDAIQNEPDRSPEPSPWSEVQAYQIVNQTIEDVAATYTGTYDLEAFRRFDQATDEALRARSIEAVRHACHEYRNKTVRS